MKKWLIDLTFKNGSCLQGMVKNTHTESGEVAKELLNGNDFTFGSMLSRDETAHMLFKLGELTTIVIKAGGDCN